MPPPGLVNDGLWRRLCPSLPLRVLIRGGNGLVPRIPSEKPCNLDQVQRRRIVYSIPEDGLIPRRRFSTYNRSRKELRDGFFQADAQVQQSASNATIESTFTKLRSASRAADYIQVQALVKYLVQILRQKPNGTIYEALILANANARYGSAQEVSKLLEEMTEGHLLPDSGTYHAVLKALAVHPDQLLRDHCLEQMRERWLTLTSEGYHYVVAGLVRERQLELALHWLDQMQEARIGVQSWLYDLFIYCLCNVEEFDEALRIMRHRVQNGPGEDSNTEGGSQVRSLPLISGSLWYHFLDTASRALHYEATLFAYKARIDTEYLNPPAGMCANIMTCAARYGDPQLATSAFNVLSKRSGNPIQLQHYETLIEAYINSSDLGTAITLLSTSHKTGNPPTIGSTRPIFIYLKESRHYAKQALDILESLRENSNSVPIAAANVVLEGLLHHHDEPAAMHLYNTLPMYTSSLPSSPAREPLKPNIHTFNMLLRSCRLPPNKARAMFLVAEMTAMKVRPDALTYDRLVLVCLHCDDDLEDAWRYYEEMRDAGFQLREVTAQLFANKACRAADKRVGVLAKEEGGPLSTEAMRTFLKELWGKGPKVNDEQVRGEQGKEKDGRENAEPRATGENASRRIAL